MQKFFKHSLEFFVLFVPLVVIGYGMYKSEMAPFEKVAFFDIYNAQNPIQLEILETKQEPCIRTAKSNSIVAKDDTFVVVWDNCQNLKIFRKKKLLRELSLEKEVLDAKIYKNHLFYYTNALYVVDLGVKKSEVKRAMGFNGDSAAIFPFAKSAIVYVVDREFDGSYFYLLYYRFKEDGRVELANSYALKKLVYRLYSKDDALYIRTGDRTYKIYPKGDELEYEVL